MQPVFTAAVEWSVGL